MSDGERSHKMVLLKAEVPEHVALELDRMAKDMGFTTRAKLLRHIISRFLRPEVTFDEFENITPPPHGEPVYSRGAVDLSPELQAALQTLNKSLDLTAAQTSIIARQNDTIHRLVGQNEHLTLTLTTGNERPALPEPSHIAKEQDQPVEEVVGNRTEPVQKRPDPVQTDTEPIQTKTEEPPRTQDKQPLPGGETVDVPGAVKMGKDMGVSYSVDTVRRAVKEEILIAVPDHSPMLIYVRDIRAFAETYRKYGKLPKMPQIRSGKALE
ncbi:MAG: hypothetical protein BWY80_00486 [Firmicutes bacterium ADurb.Bin456]|nr:MAG: hypothetical protein BWY80_00486 [Firmicutes bacterium ADurb.Bin456]